MERKEALEVVRKNMPTDRSLPVYEALQTLIPELAESEDERIRKHLVEIVEIYWGNTNDPNKAKYLAYLEKQKEQKPAEWSEEDKKMLAAISKALGCDTAEKILVNEGVTLVMAAGFLESLRPHWKPSEEQIHAIIEALKYLPNNKYEWMILNTLVDVFKKLM